jgi:hypothetical protein
MKVRRVITQVLALAIAVTSVGIGAQSAAAAAPPYDPDPNAYATITFYDASGAVVTSGDGTKENWYSYAVASADPPTTDPLKRARLYGYLPVQNVDPGNWQGQGLSTNTVYPNTSAPAPVNTATHPTVTASTTPGSDLSLATLAANYPQQSTGPLANTYQLRIKTRNELGYASASVTIDPNTGHWQQVYPVVASDTTPPTVSIDSKPATSTTDTNASFTFSGTDNVTAAGSLTFSCKLDAAVAAACTSPKAYPALAVGSHTFTVTSKDAAGNVSTAATYTWQVTSGPDTTPPTASITGKPGATSGSSSATFTFSGTDNITPAASLTFTCKLDAAAAAACTSPKTYSGLPLGSHTFTVTSTDGAGNVSAPATYTWQVVADATPPVVTVSSAPGQFSASTTAMFAFSATDNVTPPGGITFACRLDGAAYGPCTSPVSKTGLAAGAHTFAIEATDQASNTSAPVTRTWTVDTIAPVATLTGPTSITTIERTVAVTWAGSDTGSGIASYDARLQVGTWQSPMSGWQYPAAWHGLTTSGLTAVVSPGKDYCYSVRARDRAGNVGEFGPAKCTAAPLDDRSLQTVGAWSRGTPSAAYYYEGTSTSTMARGATLTLAGTYARRVSVVAVRCPTCGAVDVIVDGKVIGRINLRSATNVFRSTQQVYLAPSAKRSTITLRSVTAGRLVRIDGLAIGSF